jgi:hypothetical protein
MMESAYYHLPSPSDSERLRPYLQRQPYQTASYYPQVNITFIKLMISKSNFKYQCFRLNFHIQIRSSFISD